MHQKQSTITKLRQLKTEGFHSDYCTTEDPPSC